MYEATCRSCLFADLCARDYPCSNYTPTDEESVELELIEAGRDDYRREWERYIEED